MSETCNNKILQEAERKLRAHKQRWCAANEKAFVVLYDDYHAGTWDIFHDTDIDGNTARDLIYASFGELENMLYAISDAEDAHRAREALEAVTNERKEQ